VSKSKIPATSIPHPIGIRKRESGIVLISWFFEMTNFFKVMGKLVASGSVMISLDEIFNSSRLGHWETSESGKVARPVEVRLIVFN